VRTGVFISMRRFAFSSVAVSVLLAASAPARAETEAGTAEAVVIKKLGFVQVDDLEFGKLFAGTTAGTVVVSPSGVRTTTGGVTVAGGLVQPATFVGYGSFNQFVTISIDANTQIMTRVGGTQTMQFDTFVIGSTPSAPITTAPRTFRIGSATGIFRFPIGATLRVAANQVPGNYVGDFRITLNYQ
jgi:Domain of unknown function (DUF4402)